MTRSRLAILAISLIAMLAVPSVATASDQSVWDAYAQSTPAARAGAAAERFEEAFDRLANRVTRRRLRAANKASRALVRRMGPYIAIVKGESASSEDGRRGKTLLVRHLNGVKSGASQAGKGARAALNGKRRRAARLFNRAARTLKRARRNGKRGRAALREAGVDTSAGKVAGL